MRISRGHLTIVNDEADFKAQYTRPGQAHFAEPASALSCGQCAHFQPVQKNEYRGRCQKAANLSMKSLFSLPSFPARARACKFFAAIEEPDK